MIQEFDWEDVESTLRPMMSCAFIGPALDERARSLPLLWESWDCCLVQLEADPFLSWLTFRVSKDRKTARKPQRVELITGLRGVLGSLGGKTLSSVCVDLTSLQPAILMYLTKLLATEYRPTRFFAAYTEPLDYARSADEFLLSRQFAGLRSVPGFATRSREQERLLAFLGFEGDRLAKILEEIQFSDVIPIIGFPAYQPGWQNRSLISCMIPIQQASSANSIEKCGAASVFEALRLIQRLRPHGSPLALAPLGTRPHTMACAIYAAMNPETRIVYDHPVEPAHRSIGIGRRRCYHLTPVIAVGP
jgi:hypothetical protein